MAIKKGIEPGDIIWKFTEEVDTWLYNSETNRHERGKGTRYRYLKLMTRRARTNGAILQPEFKPFMKALGIRTNDFNSYDGQNNFIAVGVQTGTAYRKEAWDDLVVNEVAQKWYRKMKNNSFSQVVLSREEAAISKEFLIPYKDVMLEVAATSEEEEWPEEPEFQERRSNNYHLMMTSW